jgi:hypothetical protein
MSTCGEQKDSDVVLTIVPIEGGVTGDAADTAQEAELVPRPSVKVHFRRPVRRTEATEAAAQTDAAIRRRVVLDCVLQYVEVSPWPKADTCRHELRLGSMRMNW